MMNNRIVLGISLMLLVLLTSTSVMVEGASIRYLPRTGGAAYYSYRDNAIHFSFAKWTVSNSLLVDLDGDHSTLAAVYTCRTREFGLVVDLGVAYMTPDGCTIQFTWGAEASRTEINGFPCVMRTIKKEMSGETPVGEYFKWTLTKYHPPTNGIVILHQSNSYGQTLPIVNSFHYSFDDGATWYTFYV